MKNIITFFILLISFGVYGQNDPIPKGKSRINDNRPVIAKPNSATVVDGWVGPYKYSGSDALFYQDDNGNEFEIALSSTMVEDQWQPSESVQLNSTRSAFDPDTGDPRIWISNSARTTGAGIFDAAEKANWTDSGEVPYTSSSIYAALSVRDPVRTVDIGLLNTNHSIVQFIQPFGTAGAFDYIDIVFPQITSGTLRYSDVTETTTTDLNAGPVTVQLKTGEMMAFRLNVNLRNYQYTILGQGALTDGESLSRGIAVYDVPGVGPQVPFTIGSTGGGTVLSTTLGINPTYTPSNDHIINSIDFTFLSTAGGAANGRFIAIRTGSATGIIVASTAANTVNIPGGGATTTFSSNLGAPLAVTSGTTYYFTLEAAAAVINWVFTTDDNPEWGFDNNSPVDPRIIVNGTETGSLPYNVSFLTDGITETYEAVDQADHTNIIKGDMPLPVDWVKQPIDVLTPSGVIANFDATDPDYAVAKSWDAETLTDWIDTKTANEGDAAAEWVGSFDYSGVSNKIFTFTTASTTAVDIKGNPIEANTNYVGKYPIDKTSAATLDDAELLTIEVLGVSSSSSFRYVNPDSGDDTRKGETVGTDWKTFAPISTDPAGSMFVTIAAGATEIPTVTITNKNVTLNFEAGSPRVRRIVVKDSKVRVIGTPIIEAFTIQGGELILDSDATIQGEGISNFYDAFRLEKGDVFVNEDITFTGGHRFPIHTLINAGVFRFSERSVVNMNGYACTGLIVGGAGRIFLPNQPIETGATYEFGIDVSGTASVWRPPTAQTVEAEFSSATDANPIRIGGYSWLEGWSNHLTIIERFQTTDLLAPYTSTNDPITRITVTIGRTANGWMAVGDFAINLIGGGTIPSANMSIENVSAGLTVPQVQDIIDGTFTAVTIATIGDTETFDIVFDAPRSDIESLSASGRPTWPTTGIGFTTQTAGNPSQTNKILSPVQTVETFPILPIETDVTWHLGHFTDGTGTGVRAVNDAGVTLFEVHEIDGIRIPDVQQSIELTQSEVSATIGADYSKFGNVSVERLDQWEDSRDLKRVYNYGSYGEANANGPFSRNSIVIIGMSREIWMRTETGGSYPFPGIGIEDINWFKIGAESVAYPGDNGVPETSKDNVYYLDEGHPTDAAELTVLVAATANKEIAISVIQANSGDIQATKDAASALVTHYRSFDTGAGFIWVESEGSSQGGSVLPALVDVWNGDGSTTNGVADNGVLERPTQLSHIGTGITLSGTNEWTLGEGTWELISEGFSRQNNTASNGGHRWQEDGVTVGTFGASSASGQTSSNISGERAVAYVEVPVGTTKNVRRINESGSATSSGSRGQVSIKRIGQPSENLVDASSLVSVQDNTRIIATGFGPVGGTATTDITTFTVPEDGLYEYETSVEGFQSNVLAWNKTLQVRDASGGGGNLIMSEALTMGASATTAVRKMANPEFGTVTLQAGVTYTIRLLHANEFTDQLSPVNLILRRVPKTVEQVDPGLVPVENLNRISRNGNSNPGNGNPFQHGTETLNEGDITYVAGVYTIGTTAMYSINYGMQAILGSNTGFVSGGLFVNGIQVGSGVGLVNDASNNFPFGGSAEIQIALTAGDLIEFRQTATPGFGGTNKTTSISINQLSTGTVLRPEDVVVDDQTSSGYMDVGNMRMQWGVGIGATALTFPVPFANTNYRITGNATSGPRMIRFTTKSTTGVTGIETQDHNGNFTAANFDWIAIGLKP